MGHSQVKCCTHYLNLLFVIVGWRVPTVAVGTLRSPLWRRSTNIIPKIAEDHEWELGMTWPVLKLVHFYDNGIKTFVAKTPQS